jgi:hypothetical protein
LLSDKYAFRELSSNAQAAQIVDVTCLTATGTVATLSQACSSYRYSNFRAPTLQTYQKQSVWAIRVGARLEF